MINLFLSIQILRLIRFPPASFNSFLSILSFILVGVLSQKLKSLISTYYCDFVAFMGLV